VATLASANKALWGGFGPARWASPGRRLAALAGLGCLGRQPPSFIWVAGRNSPDHVCDGARADSAKVLTRDGSNPLHIHVERSILESLG
jgi:hypothetical protein